jgi:hypothetical protein
VRRHSVQYITMTLPRYRWLLPAGHTAIDLCILGIWIWQGHMDRAYLPQPPVVSRANDSPEEVAVGWEPRSCWDCESPEFILLITGALPAGIISSVIRLGAGRQTSEKLWDPAWFLILEALAIPSWFLIGARLDTGRSRLGHWMRRYLGARAVFASVSFARGLARLATVVQVLFWLGLVIYAAVQSLMWLFRAALHRRVA